MPHISAAGGPSGGPPRTRSSETVIVAASDRPLTSVVAHTSLICDTVDMNITESGAANFNTFKASHFIPASDTVVGTTTTVGAQSTVA